LKGFLKGNERKEKREKKKKRKEHEKRQMDRFTCWLHTYHRYIYRQRHASPNKYCANIDTVATVGTGTDIQEKVQESLGTRARKGTCVGTSERLTGKFRAEAVAGWGTMGDPCALNPLLISSQGSNPKSGSFLGLAVRRNNKEWS
jgi:hypothetical protein